MDLEGVLDELYGAPPERFTARRDALAREAAAAGDKALAGTVRTLRRPTAAAWVVNSLARQDPEAVAALVSLGEQLRRAQSTLSGSQMRALSRERQSVLAHLVGRATALAGGSVSPSVSQEVEQTLRAAVADEEASAAVQSGCLTHALSYTGLGPVDGGAATARHLHAVPHPAAESTPAAAVDRTTGGGRHPADAVGAVEVEDAAEVAERARERARELAEAESALRASERAAAAATTRAERSRRRQEEAEQHVADLERDLQAARDQAAAAAAAAGTAAHQATAAESVVSAAREEVERIRSQDDGA
jgi:hypothetical protein